MLEDGNRLCAAPLDERTLRSRRVPVLACELVDLGDAGPHLGAQFLQTGVAGIDGSDLFEPVRSKLPMRPVGKGRRRGEQTSCLILRLRAAEGVARFVAAGIEAKDVLEQTDCGRPLLVGHCFLGPSQQRVGSRRLLRRSLLRWMHQPEWRRSEPGGLRQLRRRRGKRLLR